MAVSTREAQAVASGGEAGRRVLDEVKPSKLGLGAAVPVGTQAALTAEDAQTVDATYGQPEADVINNLRTRLGELEARLQALGLIA